MLFFVLNGRSQGQKHAQFILAHTHHWHIFDHDKNPMHRIILSKREALLLGPQTWGRSLSMRTRRRVKKTVQKTGPGPIFSYLKNSHKDWWKVDANDPARGGGITEQAHIKLLRALTSEGPDLQKRPGFSGCQPSTHWIVSSIHSVTVSRWPWRLWKGLLRKQRWTNNAVIPIVSLCPSHQKQLATGCITLYIHIECTSWLVLKKSDIPTKYALIFVKASETFQLKSK